MITAWIYVVFFKASNVLNTEPIIHLHHILTGFGYIPVEQQLPSRGQTHRHLTANQRSTTFRPPITCTHIHRRQCGSCALPKDTTTDFVKAEF